MVGLIISAKIPGGVRVRGCDDVPAGAAIAEVIERGKTPGHVIGLVECGGRGGDETDALGDGGQGGKKREGLEGSNGMAAAQCLRGHVQDGEMIGHEKCVEFRSFELLRETRQMGEIEIGVRKGAGITPCARVEADGPHKGAEMQFAIICHWLSLSCRCFGADGSLSHPLAGASPLLACGDDIPVRELARQRLFRL
ncbi:hypothetical protein AGR2A_Lc180057 [Agrobacterium genomosp. 2 str. CFBP 5494]|uniref:Uncharacterized protein n=1 Tax=Agrobacterium genomosp. 2 str. CFBP 5494 TaxID=1183436 RepID=A0A9W5F1X8_9HYPH|nr:hypothetical protein AGR2A_Lc180057 [Agrobacterium genomosp. 2 str. CFBP 5494]